MQVLSSGVLLYAMYFVPDWMFFCLPRIISVGRALDCAVKDRAFRTGLLLSRGLPLYCKKTRPSFGWGARVQEFKKVIFFSLA